MDMRFNDTCLGTSHMRGVSSCSQVMAHMADTVVSTFVRLSEGSMVTLNIEGRQVLFKMKVVKRFPSIVFIDCDISTGNKILQVYIEELVGGDLQGGTIIENLPFGKKIEGTTNCLHIAAKLFFQTWADALQKSIFYTLTSSHEKIIKWARDSKHGK